MKNLQQFIFVFIIFNISLLATAQYDVSKISKKAIESYNKGLEKAQGAKYKEAIEALQDAIQKDVKYIDAYLSLAGVFGQIKDHTQSASTYEKAFAIDSNYTSDYRLPYSINLAGLGQFDKALTTVNTLLARTTLNPNTRKAAEYRKKTFQFAVDFAKTDAAKNYVFTPVNLGDGVNSAESEYFPSLPIQGNAMIFTRRLNNFNEDFFLSEKNAAWDKAQRLPGSINTPMNEGHKIFHKMETG